MVRPANAWRGRLLSIPNKLAARWSSTRTPAEAQQLSNDLRCEALTDLSRITFVMSKTAA